MAPQNLNGVVDSRLVVWGSANLRVVDASVIPLHIAAHTQSTVYAIGEKVFNFLSLSVFNYPFSFFVVDWSTGRIVDHFEPLTIFEPTLHFHLCQPRTPPPPSTTRCPTAPTTQPHRSTSLNFAALDIVLLTKYLNRLQQLFNLEARLETRMQDRV